MNILSRFSILLSSLVLFTMFDSCKDLKTTEAIISNQTDYDFTIRFSKKEKGYLISSNSEKTVHIKEKEYPELSFPFVSDTVFVTLNEERQYLFAKSKMDEENNIFNVNNWTYTNYTNNYTTATYTFTNSILTSMEEK